MAFGAFQPVIISIPFVRTCVAIDDLAARGRIEVAIAVVGLGCHLGLGASIGSQGAQTKAYSEAGEAKCARRQTEGWMFITEADQMRAVTRKAKARRRPVLRSVSQARGGDAGGDAGGRME